MRMMRKVFKIQVTKAQIFFVHKNTKEKCWNGFSRIIEQKQKQNIRYSGMS